MATVRSSDTNAVDSDTLPDNIEKLPEVFSAYICHNKHCVFYDVLLLFRPITQRIRVSQFHNHEGAFSTFKHVKTV